MSTRRLGTERSEALEHPLGGFQVGIWYTQEQHPTSAQFHGIFALEVREVDVEALREAWRALHARHDALRTTFEIREDGPRQLVHAELAPAFVVRDLSALSDAEFRAEVIAFSVEPFDLTVGSTRAAVLSRPSSSGAGYLVAVVTHHIAHDLDSADIIEVELPELYDALRERRAPRLPPPGPSYLRFVEQQRARLAKDGPALRALARKLLSGARSALDLPTDRPRPAVRRGLGASLPWQIPPDVVSKLRTLEGSSFFRTLLTAWAALLFRYSGQDDIVLGVAASARSPEFDGTVGDFITMLPVRVRLSREQSFLELCAAVTAAVREASALRELPLTEIVAELKPPRDPSRTALYQTTFGLVKQRRVPSMSGVAIEGAPIVGELGGLSGPSHFVAQQEGQVDLSGWCVEIDGTLYGELKFDPDLFDRATALRFAASFTTMLSAIARDPSVRVGSLDVLSSDDRSRLLAWNRTDAPFPEHRCLHELIEAQAQKSPDAVAVADERQTWTFAELDRRANRLARELRARGAGANRFVAVYMERSVDMIAALLAILKSGAAYVPVDPEYPRDRVEYMLSDADAGIVLTQSHLIDQLPGERSRTLCVDTAWESLPKDDSPLGPSCTPADMAYMIYTSGSTGRPKGAPNSHRAIVNRLVWMQSRYRLDATDCVLQKTPFSFDVSVWELFWPLLTGARLVFARPGGHRDPAYLADVIAKSGVTTLHFVPSMLRAFLEEPRVDRCTGLRRVVCSGEALACDLQDQFFARSRAELHNLYGPTEAAVDVTEWQCRPGDPVVPIGRPIANIQIHLLDVDQQPAPIGAVAELYIGGVGVGLGYHHRPELTAEKFVPDPFGATPGRRLYRTGDLARYRSDGAIEYLGRTDHQVKVRGLRIELGEIESALRARADVHDTVVVAHGEGAHVQLVAYVVPTAPPANGSEWVSDVRRALAVTLPAFFVPGRFVLLEQLPLGPSGKVDRRALPAPDDDARAAERSYEPPRSEREHILAEIWARVLGVSRVGIDDDFFDLGGDSMRIIPVLAQAKARGLTFTLEQLFAHPSIRALVEVLHEGHVDTTADVKPFALVPAQDLPKVERGDFEDVYPATRLQARMLACSRLDAHVAMYLDVFSYEVGAPLDGALLSLAIEALAVRHEILRTTFDERSFSVPMQLVRRHGGIPFAVTDLRSGSAAEQTKAIDMFLLGERARPFDTEAGPLLRFHAHDLGGPTFRLTLSFHHAILDGWSIAGLLGELASDYARRLAGTQAPALPRPRVHYRQFVAAELDARVRDAAFWESELGGYVPVRLPRAGQGERSAEPRPNLVRATITATAARDLRARARAAGVPVKSLLLGAHLLAFADVADARDLITGVVTGGRPEVDGADEVAGLFTNAVAHRQRVEGDLDAMARAALEVERRWLRHRRFPTAFPIGASGRDKPAWTDSDRPLFEVAFNQLDLAERMSKGVAIVPVAIFEQQDFALAVNYAWMPDDALVLDANHHPDLVAAETAREFLSRVAAHLEVSSG